MEQLHLQGIPLVLLPGIPQRAGADKQSQGVRRSNCTTNSPVACKWGPTVQTPVDLHLRAQPGDHPDRGIPCRALVDLRPRDIPQHLLLRRLQHCPAIGLDRRLDNQRWGWGTVLRELLQARYALTDRLGVLLADEVFFGIAEDSDTSKIAGGGWLQDHRLLEGRIPPESHIRRYRLQSHACPNCHPDVHARARRQPHRIERHH